MKRSLFIAVLVLAASSAGRSQTSFWTNATIPAIPEASYDTGSVTLGLRFYSDVAGSVTGVRFYKGPHNTGTHVGTLWSSLGTKLAEVTFSAETASGWQQANFSFPVSIAANTPYVISYLAPNGNYAFDALYPWSSLSAAPLHVTGIEPGVHAYGSAATFPASMWNLRNYSVDVVFSPSGRSGPAIAFWTNATIPAVSEASYDTGSVTLGLRFYSNVAGSVTGVRFYKGPHNTGTHVGTLWSSLGTKLAEVTFSAETASGWQQANFSFPVNIAANTPYVISYLAPNGNYAFDALYPWSSLSAAPLHVSGVEPGVYAYGSVATFPASMWNLRNYSVDVVFSPSSASGSGPMSTFWTNANTPAVPEATYDAGSVILGLKFYSDVAGSVTGVRFYKGPHNTGTHVGTLWSSLGTKLAEVTFSAETASGWQQANFSSPVSIAASMLYVISYLAPNGNYAFDDFYSWSSLSAAPLHVSRVEPGVYAYGSVATFPARTWNLRNYSVDVVFTASGSSPLPGANSITGGVIGTAATLTLSGANAGFTTTDGAGNYSFLGLKNGLYVVAPSQPGFSFTPQIASIFINGASIAGINFTAAAVPPDGLSPVRHSVSLSWMSSTSPGIGGYNVYRARVSGGPYVRLNTWPIAATSYVDYSVDAGQTYFYAASTMTSSNDESAYSNEAQAIVPTP